MEPILVVEYYFGEVKMHMRAWAIFPKKEADPAAKSVIFSARIANSGKKLVEATVWSTSCSVADFVSEEEEEREPARRAVEDLLSSAASSSRHALDWRAVLPYMAAGLSHFSGIAAGVAADYYKATGSECIGIHVLVDIMCPCFVIDEIDDDDDDDDEESDVESVGDNFELESVDC